MTLNDRLHRWFLNSDTVVNVRQAIRDLNLNRNAPVVVNNVHEFDDVFFKLYGTNKKYSTLKNNFKMFFDDVELKSENINENISTIVRSIDNITTSYDVFYDCVDKVFRFRGAFDVIFGSAFTEQHFNVLGKANLRFLYRICAAYYLRMSELEGGVFSQDVLSTLMKRIRLKIRSIVTFEDMTTTTKLQVVLVYFVYWLPQYCSEEKSKELKLNSNNEQYMTNTLKSLALDMHAIVNEDIFESADGINDFNLRVYKEAVFRVLRDNIRIPDSYIHKQTVPNMNYSESRNWLNAFKANNKVAIVRRFFELSEASYTSRLIGQEVGTYTNLCQHYIMKHTNYHGRIDFEKSILSSDVPHDINSEAVIDMCIASISKNDNGGTLPLAINPGCTITFDTASTIEKKMLYKKAVCTLIQTLYIRTISLHACNESYLIKNLGAVKELYAHFRIVHIAVSTLDYVYRKTEEADVRRDATYIPNLTILLDENATNKSSKLEDNEIGSFVKSDVLILSMIRLQNAFDAKPRNIVEPPASDYIEKIPILTKSDCVFRQKVYESAILFHLAMEGIHNDILRAFENCEQILNQMMDTFDLSKNELYALKYAKNDFIRSRSISNFTQLAQKLHDATNVCIKHIDTQLAPYYKRVEDERLKKEAERRRQEEAERRRQEEEERRRRHEEEEERRRHEEERRRRQMEEERNRDRRYDKYRDDRDRHRNDDRGYDKHRDDRDRHRNDDRGYDKHRDDRDRGYDKHRDGRDRHRNDHDRHRDRSRNYREDDRNRDNRR
jgi:hypothetical protein